MFQIKANPTFETTLTIVGQGREQQLKLVYRHKTSDEYNELLRQLSAGESKPAAAVLDLVESWEADSALDEAGLALLQQHQPGCDWAIISGYIQALQVARKGN